MSSFLSQLRNLGSTLGNAYWRKRLGHFGAGSCINSGAHIEYPAKVRVGSDCQISRNALLRANSKHETAIAIGDAVNIKENVLINSNTGNINIGDECWIGPYTLIYGNGGVAIGNHVMIASHCAINTVSHHASRLDIPMSKQGIYTAPVTIEDDVWIGIGAVILQGVRIGTGSIIGAGAVVTRDVEARTVVAGVPACVIRHREEQEHHENERSKKTKTNRRNNTHAIKYA